MRAKRLIPVAAIVLLAVGALLFFNTTPRLHPTLVLNGYELSATNTNAIVKLELRNTSRRPIWLYYSGSESPLQPEFLEKPIVVPPKPASGFGTNVYADRVGSFFLYGKKVLPGGSSRLEFPVHSRESPKHVGVVYYVGKFSDGNDFLSHLWRGEAVLGQQSEFEG